MLHTRYFLMACTVTVILSFGGTSAADPASAAQAVSSTAAPAASSLSERGHFLRLLGVRSDEELYDALYEGQTLADLALARGRSVNSVIDLQVRELEEQLLARRNAGSLSAAVYEALKTEIRETVTRSVYGV